MARVAFIGLGHMGGGMAPNLAKAGHEVRAFDLSEEALAHARAVLREYGNMSSATILFVLERALRREGTPGEWALMVGLGPGFAAEGALLRW